MWTVILTFLVTYTFYRWFTSKPRNYPPGPPVLPFIGSLFSVNTYNIHFYFEEVKKKYGPVIGFKFGPFHAVGVAGTKEVKEVFSREEFQGRPILPFAPRGIMFNEGESWTAQRRYIVRQLREFGFGKSTVEDVILEEADNFFNQVLSKKEIVQVSGLFNISTVNVLWNMIGGKKYSLDDEEFNKLLDALQRRFRSSNPSGGYSNIFPTLRKLFPWLSLFKEEIELETLLKNFLQTAVDEHIKTKTDDPRDLIDVYLTELEKPNIHPSFSIELLMNSCGDLFSAAAESVGNTIGFCLLYCILYPEWQEELYKEIETNSKFTPYLKHKNRYPKVDAFISEVSRCNPIAALAVPHKALKDTELNGYFIPKDTILLVSIWSTLQDKEQWVDPENFIPQRFLDENGNYKKDAGWLPTFGMGKRKCPGENLAMSIVFVFMISMIRKFKFSLPDGHPPPSTICLSGFTNAPRPFEVKVTKRM